jgi:hypothetical protein
MANKALITWRAAARTAGSSAREAAAADAIGLSVESYGSNRTLVSGSEEQYRELEAQGYRVKILTDTNLLRIGRYTIDTEANEPVVPAALEVAADEAADWPHHLVQLAGPPTDEWVREIEAQGVDVVEPISG